MYLLLINVVCIFHQKVEKMDVVCIYLIHALEVKNKIKLDLKYFMWTIEFCTQQPCRHHYPARSLSLLVYFVLTPTLFLNLSRRVTNLSITTISIYFIMYYFFRENIINMLCLVYKNRFLATFSFRFCVDLQTVICISYLLFIFFKFNKFQQHHFQHLVPLVFSVNYHV